MRLKLTQPGFETYSGQMGVINFTDGLSDNHVRPQDAIRMAATMLCEWEDGTPANVAQAIIDNAHTAATVEVFNELTADAAIRAQQAEANGQSDAPATPTPEWGTLGQTVVYTQAELEAIADKDGIKGLRAIATPLNVRGNSINELIRGIVAANAVTKE